MLQVLHLLRTRSTQILILAGLISVHVFGQEAQQPVSPPPAAPPSQAVDEPLPSGALVRLGSLAFRHCDAITGVHYAPDGRLVATVGRDHAVCLWDTGSGKLRRRIYNAEMDFHTLAFSPDGSRFVISCCKPSRGEGCFLQIHDTASGRELHRLVGHDQPVSAIAFAPNGSTFTTVSGDQVIRWDLELGKAIDQRGQDWPCGVAAVAPGQPLLAFASNKRDDPYVRLVNFTTGKNVLTIDGEWREFADLQQAGKSHSKLYRPEQAVVALAFSPCGKVLAVGSPFEPVRLWDLSTSTLLRKVGDAQGGIALAFSPDGKFLALGTVNGTVRLCEVESGKEVRKFVGYKAWVNCLAFAPDGKTLAMAGADSRALFLWDVATGADVRPGNGHRGPIQAVGFSPDGRTLVSVGGARDDEGQALCVWHTDTGKRLHHLGKFNSRVLALALSPGAGQLAVAEEQRLAPRLLSATGDEPQADLEVPANLGKTEGREAELRIMALAFSPDGRYLAAGASDGKIFVWDAAKGKCLRWWQGHAAMITSLAFTGDGAKLMTTAEDRTARLWDAASAKELQYVSQGEDTFGGVRLTPDGKLGAALSCWFDGRVYLWDLTSGKGLPRIPLAAKKITQIAFAPTGKMLAACESDGKITLYETATGKERTAFTGHFGEIQTLAFSPDGRRLATGSADTTVLIWDVIGADSRTLKKAPYVSAIQLLKLWQDLASADAALAYRAMCKLLAQPAQAEPFLRARLELAPPPSQQQVRAWIDDLDHVNYARRTLATSHLLELGKQVEPLLQDALGKKNSTEANQRIQVILDKLDRVELTPEQVRRERALETLEWIGTTNISHGLHAESKKK